MQSKDFFNSLYKENSVWCRGTHPFKAGMFVTQSPTTQNNPHRTLARFRSAVRDSAISNLRIWPCDVYVWLWLEIVFLYERADNFRCWVCLSGCIRVHNHLQEWEHCSRRAGRACVRNIQINICGGFRSKGAICTGGYRRPLGLSGAAMGEIIWQPTACEEPQLMSHCRLKVLCTHLTARLTQLPVLHQRIRTPHLWPAVFHENHSTLLPCDLKSNSKYPKIANQPLIDSPCTQLGEMKSVCAFSLRRLARDSWSLP